MMTKEMREVHQYKVQAIHKLKEECKANGDVSLTAIFEEYINTLNEKEQTEKKIESKGTTSQLQGKMR